MTQPAAQPPTSKPTASAEPVSEASQVPIDDIERWPIINDGYWHRFYTVPDDEYPLWMWSSEGRGKLVRI